MRTLRTRVPLLVTISLVAACGDAAQTDTEVASTSTGTSTSAASTEAATTSPTTGDSSTGPSCTPSAGPAAPTVVEPLPSRIDVVPATMVIIGSPFVDPDPGDVFGGVEAEIWRVEDGEATERVWHAEVAGSEPPELTLADGTLEDGPLREWTDHAVRLRYRDERGACSTYGPWSADLAFRTDDGSSALFNEDIVRDFYLDIPPESWQAINAEAVPPGCVPFQRSYHTGTLRFEGQTFPGVGIKAKGGCGTSRSLNGKASFKVNLSWDDPDIVGCPAERRLLGEKSFTFNNGVQDDSATHERLGYQIFRALGIPAPRMAHVRLFVNDELWGLYQHVETIDRRFLSRWFASNDGALYEGTYWCDLIPQNVPPTDDDDSFCITREFSPDPCSTPDPGADPLDYSLVRQLVEQIQALPPGGFYPAVESFFDYDRFLTTWAVESVISHWDNYGFEIKNNYRVYHDPSTGLWTLISTGIDQTFVDEQDPWAVQGVLAARCIQEPACEVAFAARLAEVNDYFEKQDIAGYAEDIFNQISPLVQEDPRKEYGFQTFVDQHNALLSFIEDRPDQIRNWLMGHGF